MTSVPDTSPVTDANLFAMPGYRVDKSRRRAFRPEVPHEVTPVTHGKRFTIVSWFA